MTIEAYPLAWPEHRKRTSSWAREDAKFDTSFARARDAVVREVEMLTGTRTYGDAKTIEALRGVARWGTGDMLAAAFTGFTALPAPPPETTAAIEPWHQVLNCAAHAPAEDVKAAYRRAASGAHPDKGGSNEAMARVNAAWATFCAERGL